MSNPGSGQTVSKYYFAGASRIAMRKYTIPQSMTVEYTLGDHLGSTSITTDSSGNKVSEMRYKPWGEVRYTWIDPNLNTTPTYSLTDYTYTGQYSNMSDFGLMFYNARWYDPYIGRFNQPDTIIPQSQGVQAWDRYAYVSNNPMLYNDPSGHCPICLTAVIGGAVGGIVGAVGYTAYVAATGREFNSTHFWMATGGGAVAGALIGTVAGAAAGVGVAGATTAAIEAGGAAEAANIACGGDMCASEVQDAGTAVNNVVQTLGADGDPTNEIVQVSNTFQQAVDVATVNGQQITVLGRFKEGLPQFAQQVGGDYLQVDPYNWGRNVKYIADAIRNGNLIVTRPDINLAKVDITSIFYREIQFLNNLDYKFVDGILQKMK